jgi:hypothetical protein
MSKRITINVPDHVAERLERESNVSAYVSRVLERDMARERDETILQAGGFRSTPEGRSWAKRTLAEARERAAARRRDEPDAAERLRQRLFEA